MRNPTVTRRGITLMEVMISIGILAIGLTSVLSIIPAGKSEVSRALIYDRATALAANALADAATFGLLKPDAVARSAPNLAVFDPSLSTGLGTGTATLKSAGIYSSPATPSLAGGTAPIILRLLAQGRDDVSYVGPVSEDALPMNQFPSVGPRAFQGRMSCIVAVSGQPPLAPGEFATLSAIVFHNRDLSSGATATTSGTWDGSSSLTAIAVPADRKLSEVVRPGTVIFTGTTFHQLAMAAIDDSSKSAFVTFSGAPPATACPIQILLDSVGLAERTVILEGAGPWSQ